MSRCRDLSRRAFLATAVGLLAIFRAPLSAQLPDAEKQKIEALINNVAGLKDTTFIRNGSDYDASTAAKFLRGKWSRNEDEIKSAQDFIKIAGTGSSTSGKPYMLRFKDGKEVTCADYLKAELAKLDAPKPAK